jgi:hypothetical protein
MRTQRLAGALLLSVSGALCAASCVQSPDPSSETEGTRAAIDTGETSLEEAEALRLLQDALPRWSVYRYPASPEGAFGQWVNHLVASRDGDERARDTWVDIEIHDLHGSWRQFHEKYPMLSVLDLLGIALALETRNGEPIPELPDALRSDDSGDQPEENGHSFDWVAPSAATARGRPHGQGSGRGRVHWMPQGGTLPRTRRPTTQKEWERQLRERQEQMREQEIAILRQAIKTWSMQVEKDLDRMLEDMARNRAEFREELRRDPACLRTCTGLVALVVAGGVLCAVADRVRILPQAGVVSLVCTLLVIANPLATTIGWPKDALKWCRDDFCEPPSGSGR